MTELWLKIGICFAPKLHIVSFSLTTTKKEYKHKNSIIQRKSLLTFWYTCPVFSPYIYVNVQYLQNSDQKAFSSNILFSRSLNCFQNHSSLFFYMLDVQAFLYNICSLLEFFSLSFPTLTNKVIFPISCKFKVKNKHIQKRKIRPEILYLRVLLEKELCNSTIKKKVK